MINESGPPGDRDPKTGENIAQWVGRKVTNGIVADAPNAIPFIALEVGTEDEWLHFVRVSLYEEYIRESVFPGREELASATIAASDPEKIRQFNEIAKEVNIIIGDGVRTQEQARTIVALRDRFNSIFVP